MEKKWVSSAPPTFYLIQNLVFALPVLTSITQHSPSHEAKTQNLSKDANVEHHAHNMSCQMCELYFRLVAPRV